MNLFEIKQQYEDGLFSKKEYIEKIA